MVDLIAIIPIDHLNGNILERFKVGSIKRSFDNLKCGSNPQNADFGDLPFDYDQRLITRRLLYCINDNIIEMLNNSSIIDAYTKRM